MRQPHTHASLHLDVTWMFSYIALFGGHSNWYSWPSPVSVHTYVLETVNIFPAVVQAGTQQTT